MLKVLVVAMVVVCADTAGCDCTSTKPCKHTNDGHCVAYQDRASNFCPAGTCNCLAGDPFPCPPTPVPTPAQTPVPTLAPQAKHTGGSCPKLWGGHAGLIDVVAFFTMCVIFWLTDIALHSFVEKPQLCKQLRQRHVLGLIGSFSWGLLFAFLPIFAIFAAMACVVCFAVLSLCKHGFITKATCSIVVGVFASLVLTTITSDYEWLSTFVHHFHTWECFVVGLMMVVESIPVVLVSYCDDREKEATSQFYAGTGQGQNQLQKPRSTAARFEEHRKAEDNMLHGAVMGGFYAVIWTAYVVCVTTMLDKLWLFCSTFPFFLVAGVLVKLAAKFDNWRNCIGVCVSLLVGRATAIMLVALVLCPPAQIDLLQRGSFSLLGLWCWVKLSVPPARDPQWDKAQLLNQGSPQSSYGSTNSTDPTPAQTTGERGKAMAIQAVPDAFFDAEDESKVASPTHRASST